MYQQEIQHQCCAGITAADAARWSEDDDHIEEMYRTGQTSIYTGPQPQQEPQPVPVPVPQPEPVPAPWWPTRAEHIIRR